MKKQLKYYKVTMVFEELTARANRPKLEELHYVNCIDKPQDSKISELFYKLNPHNGRNLLRSSYQEVEKKEFEKQSETYNL